MRFVFIDRYTKFDATLQPFIVRNHDRFDFIHAYQTNLLIECSTQKETTEGSSGVVGNISTALHRAV